MPIEPVKVPRAGESITEVTINRWLKPDGSAVKVDDPLVELGTDKATQELAASVAGVLKHLAKEGATVPIDAVIAQIDTDAKMPAPEAKPAPVQASGGRESPGAAHHRGADAPRSPEASPSPAASRILAEANLSPSQVTGTGSGGRITKGDALAAAEKPRGNGAPASGGASAPRGTATDFGSGRAASGG